MLSDLLVDPKKRRHLYRITRRNAVGVYTPRRRRLEEETHSGDRCGGEASVAYRLQPEQGIVRNGF
jgi:hypothetical protein